MTLTIHALKGWEYVCSINNGPRIYIGYYDLDDYIDFHNITNVKGLTQ